MTKKRADMSPDEIERARQSTRTSLAKWRQNNLDVDRENSRKYREANPTRRSEWGQENKEHIRQYQAANKKRDTIARWKREGFVFDNDEDYWYNRYITATVCEVTGEPFGKAHHRHLDHDHVTGRVRGVVCARINHALGNVEDSIDTLQSLIEYLT